MALAKSRRNRPEVAIPSQDRELVEKAKEKAGGNAELARIVHVDESTTSKWGQTRPIPRHARTWLLQYIHDSDVSIAAVREPASVYGSSSTRRDDAVEGLSPAVAHLLEFIHADAALDPFTGLPGGPGARQRFRQELAEAERKLAVYAEDLMRLLEHRKNELLAEARRPKGQR